MSECGTAVTIAIVTQPTDRELTASEQMRDRIADFVRTEIDRREDAGSTARRVRPALIAIEREIRRMPGRLAQPSTESIL
jgi:hypothetical protein